MEDNKCPISDDSLDIISAFFQISPSCAEYRFNQVHCESATLPDIFCDTETSSLLSEEVEHGRIKKRKEFPTSFSSSSLIVTTPLLEMFNHGKGNEVNRNPMLKRRIRRVNNNPFPRILKSDIRRSLAAMYVNVMNSGDIEMVGSFFHTFCVGHCEAVHKINDVLLNSWQISFEGLSSLKKHMQGVSAIPDLIASLEKSSIQHSLHESGSKVIMKVILSWTIVNETFVDFLRGDGQLSRTPLPVFDTLLEDNLVKEEDMICKYVVNVGAAQLKLHLWIVCYLDNSNRVYKMAFQGQMDRKQRTL